jgi:hypothetical protein
LRRETGALEIPLIEVGGAVQELASVLIDRGHPEDRVIHQLAYLRKRQ